MRPGVAASMRRLVARLALPGMSMRLAGSLSAAVVPGPAAGVLGPAVPPVPVVPAVAALDRRTVVLAARGAVTLVPRLGSGRALLGRGSAGRARCGGRLVRAGLVAMRRLWPAMRRPTLIVMALIGQGLRPFLMEGQDKPHWRDAS
jgi:hypothetical protein